MISSPTNDLNNDSAAPPFPMTPFQKKIIPAPASAMGSAGGGIDHGMNMDGGRSAASASDASVVSSLRRRCSALQRQLDSAKSKLRLRERDHRTEIRALNEEMTAIRMLHEAELSRVRDERDALRKKLHLKKKVIVEQNGRMVKVRGYIIELTDELERICKERDERRCGRCGRRMSSQEISWSSISSSTKTSSSKTAPTAPNAPVASDTRDSTNKMIQSRVAQMEERVMKMARNEKAEQWARNQGDTKPQAEARNQEDNKERPETEASAGKASFEAVDGEGRRGNDNAPTTSSTPTTAPSLVGPLLQPSCDSSSAGPSAQTQIEQKREDRSPRLRDENRPPASEVTGALSAEKGASSAAAEGSSSSAPSASPLFAEDTTAEPSPPCDGGLPASPCEGADLPAGRAAARESLERRLRDGGDNDGPPSKGIGGPSDFGEKDRDDDDCGGPFSSAAFDSSDYDYFPDPSLGVHERARLIHRRSSDDNGRSVPRRTSLDALECIADPDFGRLVLRERWRNWASSLLRLDPRHQILTYFDDVARDGGTLMTAAAAGDAKKRGSRGSLGSLGSLGGAFDPDESVSAFDDGEKRPSLNNFDDSMADLGESGLSFFAAQAARQFGGGGDGTRSSVVTVRASNGDDRNGSGARGSSIARMSSRRQRRRSSAVLHPELQSPLLRLFDRSSVFTVWRPCSLDAIRAMMTGAATGKGLDVKGKSAKRGRLSGFVPFVQIHEEGHKRIVTRIPEGARVRVFHPSQEGRDEAADHLEWYSSRRRRAAEAEDADAKSASASLDRVDLVDDYSGEKKKETSCKGGENNNNRPCWGLECPLRLFWDACVVARPIERDAGSDLDTGRPSEPAFQDMNIDTVAKGAAAAAAPSAKEGAGTKDLGGVTRAVIYQSAATGGGSDDDCGDPLDPRTLVMAYEEKGRVLPVVSDLDCFIVGTRGVRYGRSLPPEQVGLVKWCVSGVESILDEQRQRQQRRSSVVTAAGTDDETAELTWSKAWLEVLKRDARGETNTAAIGDEGKVVVPKKPVVPVPKFGFGDPTSYKIMEHAVGRLKCGAVRHGAECFNYSFPQEIDDEFLVVSDTLPGNVPWKYVSEYELRELLIRKIDEGFSFPLNPKWILCDPGWSDVYDRLLSSDDENVQNAMEVWFPPSSGIRERIQDVCARHPGGFQEVTGEGVVEEEEAAEEQSLIGGVGPPRRSLSRGSSNLARSASSRRRFDESTEAMDLAELELRRYLVLRRAKRKLRAVLTVRRLSMGGSG